MCWDFKDWFPMGFFWKKFERTFGWFLFTIWRSLSTFDIVLEYTRWSHSKLLKANGVIHSFIYLAKNQRRISAHQLLNKFRSTENPLQKTTKILALPPKVHACIEYFCPLVSLKQVCSHLHIRTLEQLRELVNR